MTLNLNDYRNMTEPEAYREALEDYGLDFDTYDDPDMMWSDLLKAVKESK